MLHCTVEGGETEEGEEEETEEEEEEEEEEEGVCRQRLRTRFPRR